MVSQLINVELALILPKAPEAARVLQAGAGRGVVNPDRARFSFGCLGR